MLDPGHRILMPGSTDTVKLVYEKTQGEGLY